MFLKHGAKNVNGIRMVAPTGFEPVFKLLPATTGPWPAPTTTESGVVCENCPSPPPGRAARTVTTP